MCPFFALKKAAIGIFNGNILGLWGTNHTSTSRPTGNTQRQPNANALVAAYKRCQHETELVIAGNKFRLWWSFLRLGQQRPPTYNMYSTKWLLFNIINNFTTLQRCCHSNRPLWADGYSRHRPTSCLFRIFFVVLAVLRLAATAMDWLRPPPCLGCGCHGADERFKRRKPSRREGCSSKRALFRRRSG